MRRSLVWRRILGGAVLGSLLVFQNCSDTGLEEGNDSLSSYMEGLPFAYKASLDTIAYMSCSRMKNSYEPRAFFTFRAGAYTPLAGLEITPEFAEATKYYTLQTKSEAFADSLANSNTRPQLALRSSSNLQSVVVNGAAKSGTSLGTMLSNLSRSPIMEHLVTMQPGMKKNYFASGANDRLLAGSLRFNDGDEENVAAEIRKILKNNEVLLALTFTDTDNPDDAKARGPAGVMTSQAYGRGYQLQFGVPDGWTTAEQRVVTAVNEVNLTPGYPSTGAQWSCPTTMQFKIVRPEDLADAGPCSLSVDYYSTEDQRVALDAIRRVLPVEDFYVDVVNRCVVPKAHIATESQSCYGDRTGRGAINYTSSSCSGDSCPHHVSVCIKVQ